MQNAPERVHEILRILLIIPIVCRSVAIVLYTLKKHEAEHIDIFNQGSVYCIRDHKLIVKATR